MTFLGLLALWWGFVLLGAPLLPPAMAYVMALPPLHVPIDLQGIQLFLGAPPALALAALVGLGVGRGLILGSMALLVLGAVRGAEDVGPTLRRLPRVVVALFGIYGVEVALFLFLLLSLQPIVGPAAFLVVPVLGLHFLGFAPVVAAAEEVPAGTALRLALRASRLPGTRHLTLVLVYFLVVQYVGAAAAALGSSTAAASVFTWGLALVVTFGHAAMLGALAYRWESVRERVLAEEDKRRAERRAARGRGRGKQPARTAKDSTGTRTGKSARARAKSEDRREDGREQEATAGGEPGRPRRARRGSKGRSPRKGRRR